MQHTIKKGTTAVKNYVWSSSCLLFQYIKNLIYMIVQMYLKLFIQYQRLCLRLSLFLL